MNLLRSFLKLFCGGTSDHHDPDILVAPPPTQWTIGSRDYRLGPSPVAHLRTWRAPQPLLKSQQDFPVPVTVVHCENADDVTCVTVSSLKRQIEHMKKVDDVFSDAFAKYILISALKLKSKGPRKDSNTKAWLQSKGMRTTNVVLDKPDILPGPYFLYCGRLYEAWRVYDDHVRAFVMSVFQVPMREEKSEYNPSVKFVESTSSGVAVPSRLYFPPPSESKPLSGYRIAVKDIIDLRGLKTGCSSRAYLELYPVASDTASCIKKLQELGAVVIGKTKTTQFACGESPMDWVDCQCPFNPRGDGYLTTSGSSAGSAAAVAAYEWLDIAIGSDTFGSILYPAAWQGVFGIRPSHGLLDLRGVFPHAQIFDTLGYFARSSDALLSFGKAWYGSNSVINKSLRANPTNPQKLLLCLEEFRSYPDEARTMILEFVSDLEKAFHVSKTEFSIEKCWDQQGRAGTGQPVRKYLDNTLATIQLHDCYKNTSAFRKEYESMFGCSPYVNPLIRFKWDLGAKIPDREYQKALEQKDRFRKFLEEYVFSGNTLMIVPVGSPSPKYRDVYSSSPEDGYGLALQGYGWSPLCYTVLGGLPAVTVPIGQLSYYSRVSERQEFMPLSVLCIGPQGSDIALMQTIDYALRASGRSTTVAVGRTVFPVPYDDTIPFPEKEMCYII